MPQQDSQPIDPQEVRKIGALARIHLTEEEVETLAHDLAVILTYIEQLKELNVDNVPPTSHVCQVTDVFREDQPRPSLCQEEALSVAVDKRDGFFVVPQVVEGADGGSA